MDQTKLCNTPLLYVVHLASAPQVYCKYCQYYDYSCQSGAVSRAGRATLGNCTDRQINKYYFQYQLCFYMQHCLGRALIYVETYKTLQYFQCFQYICQIKIGYFENSFCWPSLSPLPGKLSFSIFCYNKNNYAICKGITILACYSICPFLPS